MQNNSERPETVLRAIAQAVETEEFSKWYLEYNYEKNYIDGIFFPQREFVGACFRVAILVNESPVEVYFEKPLNHPYVSPGPNENDSGYPYHYCLPFECTKISNENELRDFLRKLTDSFTNKSFHKNSLLNTAAHKLFLKDKKEYYRKIREQGTLQEKV